MLTCQAKNFFSHEKNTEHYRSSLDIAMGIMYSTHKCTLRIYCIFSSLVNVDVQFMPAHKIGVYMYICVLLNSLNWMKLLSAKIKKEQISKEIKLHFCWTNWMNITIYFFNLTENRSGKPFEAIFLFARIFNLIFPIVFRGMILQWQ